MSDGKMRHRNLKLELWPSSLALFVFPFWVSISIVLSISLSLVFSFRFWAVAPAFLCTPCTLLGQRSTSAGGGLSPRLQLRLQSKQPSPHLRHLPAADLTHWVFKEGRLQTCFWSSECQQNAKPVRWQWQCMNFLNLNTAWTFAPRFI